MGTCFIMSRMRNRHGADAAAKAKPSLVALGRLGWFSKGVVYVLAGILALFVAFRSLPALSSLDQEASPTGALKAVAAMGGGRALLITLATGLSFYTVWRVATALLPGHFDLEALAMRIGYLVSALLYGTLSATAFALARRPHQQADGNAKVTDVSARVLDARFGRIALGTVGAVAVGAAIFRIVKAARGDVNDELTLHGMSSRRVRVTTRLGIAGEIGRGIAVGLIGFFLVRAALDHKADEATGLDGALTRLARSDWGRFVVGVVAVGFLLYGILCIATFNRRTLRAP